MAVTIGNVENGNNETVFNAESVAEKPASNNYRQPEGLMDPFAEFTKGIISAGGVATNLVELKEKIEAISKAKNNPLDVIVLDKDIFTSLKYSSLCVYKKEKTRVSYYIVLLAGTGRKSLTAKESLRLAEIAKQEKRPADDDLFTYADAIDTVLHSLAVDQIVATTRTDLPIVPVTGIVVPYNVDPLTLVERITVSIANSFYVEDLVAKGGGLDIKKLNQNYNGKGRYKFSIATHKEGTIVDRLGNTIRADFTAALDIKDTSNQNFGARTVNRYNRDVRMAEASGYITGYPVYRGPRVDNLGKPLPEWTIQPQIVITNVRTYIPDLQSTILGVAVGSLVASHKQYLKVIIDTLSEEHNPGLYNLLTKAAVGMDKHGRPVVEPIDCLSPARVEDKAYLLEQIFGTEMPMISLDINTYGESYDTLLSLIYADTNAAAKDEVARAVQTLLGGTPLQFGRVAAHRNILPAGTYNTKKSQRDIRDFELDKFIYLTKLEDQTATNMFFNSMAFDNDKTIDLKIELLANYLPDSLIDGKTTRLTLDPQFLESIVNAAVQSGLVTEMDQSFMIQSNGLSTGAFTNLQNLGFGANYGAQFLNITNPGVGYGNMVLNSYNLYTPRS